MTLYANLLDPKKDSPGSISRAPVLFRPGGSSEERKPIDAGEFFAGERGQFAQHSLLTTGAPSKQPCGSSPSAAHR